MTVISIQFRSMFKEKQTRWCRGGQSWQCNMKPHQIGRHEDIFCYRCKVRLGCSNCVSSLSEVICLQCHNYGHRYGVAKHGNMVPSIKLPRVRTDEGIRKWEPAKSDPIPELLQSVTKTL